MGRRASWQAWSSSTPSAKDFSCNPGATVGSAVSATVSGVGTHCAPCETRRVAHRDVLFRTLPTGGIGLAPEGLGEPSEVLTPLRAEP